MLKAVVWASERVFEILLIAWFMFNYFGPTNASEIVGAGENVLYVAQFILIGFIFSGYLLTTGWWEVWRDRGPWWQDGAAVAVLFCLHCIFLPLDVKDPDIATVIGVGALTAFLTASIGSLMTQYLNGVFVRGRSGDLNSNG